MRNSSQRLFPLLLALAGGLALLAGARAAEVSDIMLPPKRQEMVDAAKKMLAQREAPALTVDPFHPESANDAPVAHTGPATDNAPHARNEHELLEAIAAGLKPSGNFNIGGQQTLLFGQKKVKAGGTLTITFEGNEYTLEVTAIQRTSFTLRLNREEFTRPIK